MTKLFDHKNLLVYEDDAESAELIKYIFEKRGFNIFVKSSIDNYVQDMANFQPCIILMDLRIPNLGGEIVCRNIKMSYKVPVILCSAEYNLEEISSRANADDFIQKPYQIKEIIDAVEAQCQKLINGPEEKIGKPPGKNKI